MLCRMGCAPRKLILAPPQPLGFALLNPPYIMTMSTTLRNNTARSRFELDVDGGTAVANYKIDGNIITFTHTEVPLRARGAGVASRLIQGALETARSQGLKVVARCSFVQAYLAKHPEFHDLTA
jgi:uncharacterized protein